MYTCRARTQIVLCKSLEADRISTAQYILLALVSKNENLNYPTCGERQIFNFEHFHSAKPRGGGDGVGWERWSHNEVDWVFIPNYSSGISDAASFRCKMLNLFLFKYLSWFSFKIAMRFNELNFGLFLYRLVKNWKEVYINYVFIVVNSVIRWVD